MSVLNSLYAIHPFYLINKLKSVQLINFVKNYHQFFFTSSQREFILFAEAKGVFIWQISVTLIWSVSLSGLPLLLRCNSRLHWLPSHGSGRESPSPNCGHDPSARICLPQAFTNVLLLPGIAFSSSLYQSNSYSTLTVSFPFPLWKHTLLGIM